MVNCVERLAQIQKNRGCDKTVISIIKNGVGEECKCGTGRQLRSKAKLRLREDFVFK